MARRSTIITFSNGMDLDLALVGTAGPCHGIWTNNTAPPQKLRAAAPHSWETESQGSLTGTEGWVKYQIKDPDQYCVPELVYIHWENPFEWDSGTTPIDMSVTTANVTPPCDSDKRRQGPRGDGRAGEWGVREGVVAGCRYRSADGAAGSAGGCWKGCSRPACDAAGHGSFRSRIRACEEGVQR